MESAFLKIIEQNQNIIHKVSRIYRDTKEDQEDLFQEIVFQHIKNQNSPLHTHSEITTTPQLKPTSHL